MADKDNKSKLTYHVWDKDNNEYDIPDEVVQQRGMDNFAKDFEGGYITMFDDKKQKVDVPIEDVGEYRKQGYMWYDTSGNATPINEVGKKPSPSKEKEQSQYPQEKPGLISQALGMMPKVDAGNIGREQKMGGMITNMLLGDNMQQTEQTQQTQDNNQQVQHPNQENAPATEQPKPTVKDVDATTGAAPVQQVDAIYNKYVGKGDALSETMYDLMASGQAQNQEEAQNMAMGAMNRAANRLAQRTTDEFVSKLGDTVEGVDEAVMNGWHSHAVQDNLKKMASQLGIMNSVVLDENGQYITHVNSYDQFINGMVKPAMVESLVKKYGENYRKIAEDLATRLYSNDEVIQNQLMNQDIDEALSSVISKYVNPSVVDEYNKAQEAGSKAFNEGMEGSQFIPANLRLGTALGAQYEANEAKDPAKVLSGLQKKFGNLYRNPEFLNDMSNAAFKVMQRYGLNGGMTGDPKQFKPIINSVLKNELDQLEIKGMMPKGSAEYIMKTGLGNTIVGKIIRKAVQTDYQNWLEDIANQQYQPGFWENVASGALTFAGDAWSYWLPGAAGGKLTKSMVAKAEGKLAGDLMAKGMERKMAERAAKVLIGKSKAAALKSGAVHGAVTFGGQSAISKPIDEVYRTGQFDENGKVYNPSVGKIIADTLGEVTKQSAVGAIMQGGTIANMIGKGRGLATNILADVGGKVVDSGIMTGHQMLERMAQDPNFKPTGKDAAESFLESMANLTAIGLPGMLGKYARFKDAREFNKKFDFTDQDIAELKRFGYDGLRDAFEKVGIGEYAVVGENAQRLDGQLTQKYMDLMNDKSVPEVLKAKMMAVVEGKRPSSFSPVVDSIILKPMDNGGKVYLETLNKDGGVVDRKEYSSLDEAQKADKKLEYEKTLGLASVLEGEFHNEFTQEHLEGLYNKAAQKYNMGEKLTDEDKVAVYLHQNAGAIKEIMDKQQKGIILTDEEQKQINAYRHYYDSALENSSVMREFVNTFEDSHGVARGTLRKALESKDKEYAPLVESYLKELYNSIELKREMKQTMNDLYNTSHGNEQKRIEQSGVEGEKPAAPVEGSAGGQEPPVSEGPSPYQGNTDVSSGQGEGVSTANSDNSSADVITSDAFVMGQNAYKNGDSEALQAIDYNSDLATGRLKRAFADNEKMPDIVANAYNEGRDMEQFVAQRASSLTPAQKEAISKYVEAMDAKKGTIDALQHADDGYGEALKQQLWPYQTEDGNIVPATLDSGKQVFLKKDNEYGGAFVVVPDEQGLPTIKQVSKASIIEQGTPVPLDEYIEKAVAQQKDARNKQFISQFDGSGLKPNDQVTVAMEEGDANINMTFAGYSEDGKIVLTDGKDYLPLSKEEFAAWRKNALDNTINQHLDAEDAKREQEAVSQAEADKKQRYANGIVGLSEGQPDYSSKDTDPNVAAEYLQEQFGEDHGQLLNLVNGSRDDIKTQLANKRKAAAEYQNWLDTNADLDPEKAKKVEDELSLVNEQIADIDARFKNWNTIRNSVMTPDEVKAMKEERKAEIERAGIDKSSVLPDVYTGVRIPENSELKDKYPTQEAASGYITSERRRVYKMQEETQREIDGVDKILNQYMDGDIELSAEQLRDLSTTKAELTNRQNALTADAKALKGKAESLNILYIKERAEQNKKDLEALSPKDRRKELVAKALEKKDMKAIKEIYKDASTDVMDLTPQTLEEFVSERLFPHSLNAESLAQELGSSNFSRGIGSKYDTNKFNYLLAKNGEGLTISELAKRVWEDLSSTMESGGGDGLQSMYTDQDVRNAILDMFKTYDSVREMRNVTLLNRIAAAENELSGEEEWYEQQKEREIYEKQAEIDEYKSYIHDKELSLPSESELDHIYGLEYDRMMEIEDREREYKQYVKSILSELADYDDRSNEEGYGGGSSLGSDSSRRGVDEGNSQGEEVGNGEASSESEIGEGSDSGRKGRQETGGLERGEGSTVRGSHLPQEASFGERLKNAIAETETEPTEAQKKAGNYKKGHLSFGGYDYTVETPKGATRSGKDEQGKPWSVTMHDTYGYILGKIGVDGDHIDMFINDAADLDTFNANVYVVDQVNPETGEFDEHKVMYGYPDEAAATKAYLSNYSKGWKGLGKVTSVPKATFDKWLESSDRKTKPFADYTMVQTSLQKNNSSIQKDNPVIREARKRVSDALDALDKFKAEKQAFYKKIKGIFKNKPETDAIEEARKLIAKWRNDSYAVMSIDGFDYNQKYQGANLPGEVYRAYEKAYKAISGVDHKIEHVSGTGFIGTISDSAALEDYINGLYAMFIGGKLGKKFYLEDNLPEIQKQVYKIAEDDIKLGRVLSREGVKYYDPNLKYADPKLFDDPLVPNETFDGWLENPNKKQDDNLPFAPMNMDELPFHRDVKEVKPENLTEAQKVAYDAVSTMLKKAGIPVKVVSNEDMEKVAEAQGKGVVYGYTDGKEIVLNQEHLNPNTPIHEYQHLWRTAAKEMNPELIEYGDKLIMQTQLFADLKKDPNYKHLSDEQICDEAFARLTGEDGAAILEQMAKDAIKENPLDTAKELSVINKLKEWLKKFWYWTLDTFTKWKPEDIKKMTLEDIRNLVLRDLANGVDPRTVLNEKRAKKDDKTLAGVHNITEEKLRKALKLGGFANPSLAVIDTNKSGHDNFGEISFIAPSALLDKRTGKTAGTWTTDAYTQRYPSVEREMSEKGSQKFRDWVNSLEYPSEAKAEIKRQAEDALSNNNTPAWELMYLKEKGIDIKEYDSKVDYRWKDIINDHPTAEDILNSMQNDPELNEKVASLVKHTIIQPTWKKVSLEVRRKMYEETGVKVSPINPQVRKQTKEIFERDYAPTLLDKDGKPKAEDIKKVVEGIVKEHNDTKKYDFYLSKVKASNYVNNNGLYDDYIRWQEKKLDEFGTESRIFRGYTKDGLRKYVPETLENVSKVMREEAYGQTNGSEYTSFGSFIAKLASRADSTEEMRANKDKLSSNEDKEAFYEKWQDVYYDLAKTLYNDVFYGEQRLHDIVSQPDPKKYAKKEYGITLTPSFMKNLDALKKAVQTDLKSAYFETKFNRPVHLNEFVAAVVPNDLGEDVRKGLEESGLSLFDYDPEKEGDRSRAFNEAINSNNQIRFHRVTEPEELDRLNKEKTFRMYSGMQEVDGKLYSPMAAIIDGKRTDATEIGAWMGADERPDLVKNGKFQLVKTDKNPGAGEGPVRAAYNPYMHTSTSMMNDQFTGAYARGNIKVVEWEIPESEKTSGYRAEGAKDAVGLVPWHSGSVNSLLPKDRQRSVMLSRWRKAVRVVPDSEVAESIAEQIEGTGLAIPWNVVTPNQLRELVKLGVPITTVETGLQAPETKEKFLAQMDELKKEFPEAQFLDVKMTKDAYKEWGVLKFSLGDNGTDVADGNGDSKNKNPNKNVITRRIGSRAQAQRRVNETLGAAADNFRRNQTATAEKQQGTWDRGPVLGYVIRAAKKNLSFIPDEELKKIVGDSIGHGEENFVYHAKYDDTKVIKLNDFTMTDGLFRINEFIDRINAHNQFMPEDKYTPLGFAYNQKGDPCIVMEQPYLKGTTPTREEITQYLTDHGFKLDMIQISADEVDLGWTNGEFDLWDAEPRNVIKDENGDLHFFDTMIQHTYIPKHKNPLRLSMPSIRTFESQEIKKSADKVKNVANVLGGAEAVTYTSSADVPEEYRVAIEQGAKGWYDPATHTVHVYLPNCEDGNDAQRTVFHEKIGHEGMEVLLGGEDEVRKFANFVYNSVAASTRGKILEIANEYDPDWKNPDRMNIGTQEYIAHLAEEGPKTAEDFTLWTKIKHYLIRLLKKLGIRVPGLLNDKDLRYYLMKAGKALHVWDNMPKEKQEAMMKQASNAEIKDSLSNGPGKGKPQMKKGESTIQYMKRVQEWRKWKNAREDKEDPEPPMFYDIDKDEAGKKEWAQLNKDWREKHHLAGEEPMGMPIRMEGEEDGAYMTRIHEYEKWKDAMKDQEDPMPDMFAFEKKKQEEVKRKYEDWLAKHDLLEQQQADLDLYEGKIYPAETNPKADALEQQVMQDLAEVTSTDVSKDGAAKTVKHAVIHRRKNMEEASADDAIYINDVKNRIEKMADSGAFDKLLSDYKGKPNKAEKLAEAIPYIIEAPRRLRDLAHDLNATDAFDKGHIHIQPTDVEAIQPFVADLIAETGKKHTELKDDKEVEVYDDPQAVGEVASKMAQAINANHQGEEGFVPIDGTDILSKHVLPLVKQQIVPKGIDYKNLSPEMKSTIDSIRDWYNYTYDWLKDNHTLREDTGYNADYVNHIWDKEKSDKQAYALYVENRQRTKSPNEKPRTISTLMEGISVGLVPKTTDITKMMAYYSRSNIEAWANKTMLQELSGLNVIERNEDGEIVSSDPLLSSTPPFNLEQYKYFEIPGVGPVWVYNVSPKQMKVKNPVTGKEKVLYSEASAGDRFGVVFETYQSSPFWKAFDTLASSAKKLELGFSGFHAGALTEVYMVQNMVEFGPKKAMANFMKYIFVDTMKNHQLPCFANPEDFQEAATHLVKFGATNDYAAADVQNMFDNMRDAMMKVQEKLKDGNKISGTVALATMPLKVATQMLSLINKGMDRALWDFLHDGLKLATYRMRADKTKERAKKKGWTEEELSRALDEDGQFVNDMFGGQHWDILGASHRTLRYAGRVLLSPDWNASTTRHFLALTGYGSIWNEATFENFKQYYQRLKHKELIPEDEGRRSRQISALLCYGIGFMVFYEGIANGINAAFRAMDEEKERKKAEEIRKTNPNYKSMYELAYPDGMKWYDYLMRGNSLGQQSKIFMGRYADGTEMYIRHGKQFREVPEYLFNHKGELEFPGPMVQRMIGKANPMVRMTLDDINYLSDFQASHADQEIQRKYGKTIGLLYKDALYWAPFLIPSQENKEFKAVDFFFPSSKGFSPWKAQSYFKDFILSGDMEGVVMTYQSCQRNGIDAEAQIKAAIGSVKALESAEMSDGVTSLQEASQRFDAAKSITEKKKMRQKMKKFLSQSDYKAFTQKEALAMVQGYLNGDDDLKEMEKAESKYLMKAKAEDVTEDWRIQNVWNGTMETYQEYQRLKDVDKAKANAFKNSKTNKRLFAARKAIRAAKKKMNKAKKQMDGTNGGAKMAEIRKTRKELLEKLNGME